MPVNKCGTLYLVATPIGNLEDITLRALRVLREVDLIACEDTRHSLSLLNRYEIKKPLVSYHKFNETGASETLIEKLKSGLSVAIITDAGTPCISDPGSKIVAAARENLIPVSVIPGPSAVVTACSLTGIDSGFCFYGFLPDDNTARKSVLQSLSSVIVPLVFYVAPHDLKKDVADIYKVFGDRKLWLVRELTKVYEEAVCARLSTVDVENARGEYVLIVYPAEKEEDPLLSLSLDEHIKAYMELGYDLKEIAKKIAKERALERNEVYKRAVILKNGD